MPKSQHNADERRSARAKVLLTATIDFEGARTPVRVINLSAHGALVLADHTPPEDAPVKFRCKGRVVEGWIAWIRAPHAGVHFSLPIQPKTMLPKNPGLSSMIVKDDRQVTVRRPGFRGNLLIAEERQILESWERDGRA